MRHPVYGEQMRAAGAACMLVRNNMGFIVRIAGIGLGAGFTYEVFLGDRSDYAGHFLAGFGATLCLVSPTLLLEIARFRWTKLVLTAAAVGLGALIEATIFRFAIFDPVDFFNQSLGACLAAACTLERAGSLGTAVAAMVCGAIFVAAGFHFAFA